MAKADAVGRTNAAIVQENQSHTEGNTMTNGQRRAAPGATEAPLPNPGSVASAAEQQYNDVFQLATDAINAAKALQD